MDKKVIASLIGSALLMGTQASASEILAENSKSVISGQYIVVYKDSPNTTVRDKSERIRKVASKYRGKVKKEFKHALTGAVLEMNHFDAELLANDPNVLFVEQDRVVSIAATQYNPTWGLDRIDQGTSSLDKRYIYPNNGGAGVHVYVLDTGMDLDHPSYAGRVGNGADTYDPGPIGEPLDPIDPFGTDDCHGHGTHVAGTIGATEWGVAKNVTLHPVRVLGCSGDGSLSGVIAGMDWVVSNHQSPAVVNMSLGGYFSEASNQAVERLVDAGVTVVVAAGNAGVDACQYSPASAPNAITVGASNSADERARFDQNGSSNYGDCLDIYAPGLDIMSSQLNGGSKIMSGTSAAAPHVAGAAALYLAQNKGATPAQVRNALISNSEVNAIYGHVSGPNNLLNIEFLEIDTGALPTVPTNFRAISEKCYSLNSYTWNPVSGASYYEIWKDKNGVKSKLAETSSTDITVRVSGATISAKACNANGCSGNSNGAPSYYYPYCM